MAFNIKKTFAMNGIDFLADTNILLYFLEGNPAVSAFAGQSLAVSAISEIELLGWHKISKQETSIIKGMLSNCFVIELIPAVKKIAIELKQKHKLKLPDAVIVATAIHLRVPLLTADKGFSQLKEADIFLIEI